MKPPDLGVVIVIVAVLFAAVLHYIVSAHSAEPPKRPNSCRLYDEAKRKCDFGECDQREIWRLRKKCLRDSERP